MLKQELQIILQRICEKELQLEHTKQHCERKKQAIKLQKKALKSLVSGNRNI